VKRKLILYPLIGIFVLAVGLVGIWYWIGMAGTSPLERWIGTQVKSIAGSYLNPRVEFDDIDYQRPYTVVLTKFRLTADDPDKSGQTLDVIYVDKLRLELAEIPSEGKPIRIKKLILDHPKINAIAARSNGKFIGFQNMLKEKSESGTKPAQKEPSRLSDVFQIVLLQIIEGQVVYESRGSGQPPMILDAINSRMDVEKDDQGWYKLAATLDRKPVFALNAKGRLDLDHLVLALDALQLDIELGKQQYSKLPGQIQQMLKEHEITGTLKLAVSGRLPLGDAASCDLAATLSMDKAHFVAGEYKGEAKNVNGKLLLKNRRAVLDHLDAETLKGKIHLAADVVMVDPFDGRIQLTVKDIMIEEAMRGVDDSGKPKYKGAVNADITLSGPMNKILTRSSGDGSLTLRNGRLAGLRVIADIGQALAQKINSILSGEKESKPDTDTDTDTADLEFQFVGDKIHFTKIFAQTSTFAIKGHGDVWFDKRLNLLLNGGPAQRLQSVTDGDGGDSNQVVDALGKILHGVERGATDIASEVLSQVATVVVSGTTDKPKVQVEPFRKIRDVMGGK
jgi:hypothetical protein